MHQFDERPPVGAWARAVLRAAKTRPGDAAEHDAAEHEAAVYEAAVHDAPARDAAVHDAAVHDAAERGAAAAESPEIGVPSWGPGRPLTADERAWHEPRLGADIGEVRVHDGEHAGRWATAFGARAFAIGRDVVLGPHAYSASTAAGRSLLAHELAHVVAGRGGPPVLARVALSQPDLDTLALSLHDAITTATADEELVFVALQRLDRDPTAAASLSTTYKAKYGNDLAKDLAARLKGSSLALALTLLAAPKAKKLAASPSTQAEYDACATKVHAALVAKTPDRQAVYAALLPLERDPVKTSAVSAAYTRLFSSILDADIAAKLTGADGSYALYLLHGPVAAAPRTIAGLQSQPGAGTSPSTAPPALPGGAVSVGTHTPYTTTQGKTGTYTFGVGYSGGLAADTHWLQFIERGIDVTKKGTTTSLSDTISVHGVTYALGTLAAPNWQVDSYHATDPFYDETNQAWRDAGSVTMYDAPQDRKDLVDRELKAGATTVVSRAQFDTYLIRDFSAVYHVAITVVWTSTSSSHHAVPTVTSAGTVTGLPAALKAALVTRYPAYAYLR